MRVVMRVVVKCWCRECYLSIMVPRGGVMLNDVFCEILDTHTHTHTYTKINLTFHFHATRILDKHKH